MKNNKHLIGFLIIVLFFLACRQPSNQISATENHEKPNIVIIYADDMGYGDLACQNPNTKLTTPNLDKLASSGIRFTDGHSSSGICTPSRYALLTGQYHWRRLHGIVKSFGKPVFKDGEFTLPQMLKEQGYNTACIGKWHLGWDWEFLSEPHGEISENKKAIQFYLPNEVEFDKPIKGGPIDRGFDYYFGDGTINFPPYAFVENDRLVEKPTENLDLRGMETLEGNWEFRHGPMVKDWNPFDVLPTITQKAKKWIGNQSNDKPFFLYFALPSPHAPIIPNEEFRGKTEAGAYGDFIYQTDWVAGQVINALNANGLDENTIVIFTADNGPEYYAYNRIKNTGHKSTGELRGLKRDTWEGGHRVPFIISWPGKIKGGQVLDEVVHQVDLTATIAAITGIHLSADVAVDSYNLLPILLNEEYSSPLREATVHNTYKNRYAIRKDKWLLINSYSGEHTKSPDWFNEQFGYEPLNEEQEGQLFDLSKDLAQKKNLFDQHPEKVEELRTILTKYRQEGRSIPRSPSKK
jgi:arylsulfatase A-like enzyme